MNEGEVDEGARHRRQAELASRLRDLEREHLEVLRAGLSVPGGARFSERLHELEHEADLIRLQLGIPTRSGIETTAFRNPGDISKQPRCVERKPLVRFVRIASVILVAGGLLTIAFAIASGYWGGLGGAITAILGGSFSYWFVTTNHTSGTIGS